MITIDGSTYIHRIDVAFMEGVHVTVRQQTVREQRQKDEFREGEQLISREREASPSAVLRSVRYKYLITVKAYLRSSVICSSAPTSV